MVTMSITFDNQTILPAIEKLITNLKGVNNELLALSIKTIGCREDMQTAGNVI
jgi:hypothetical protein